MAGWLASAASCPEYAKTSGERLQRKTSIPALVANGLPALFLFVLEAGGVALPIAAYTELPTRILSSVAASLIRASDVCA